MKRFINTCAAVLFVLALAGLAHASGDAGEHGLPWGNYLLRVVNFAIFVGIIWYLAGKKIASFFGGRRNQIKKDLDDLEVRQNEAAKRLKDVEQSIANLDAERKALLDEARAQGEALKAAIIEKARKDSEQIKAQARMSSENESKAAVDALRAQMADLIVEAATKIVSEKLSAQDHERLVDEYLTKVVLN